jgi:predicted nucleotidyltransferase
MPPMSEPPASASADAPALRRLLIHLPPRPLLLSLAGSRLYGFPSAGCDYDIRGVHLLPPESVLRIERPLETFESKFTAEGLAVDLISLDLRRFLELVLRKTGFVFELALGHAPVMEGPHSEELRLLVRRAMTRSLYFHYEGLYRNRLGEFHRGKVKRAADLLHMYRALLTGRRLLAAGELETSLPALLAADPVPEAADLLAMQVSAAPAAVRDDKVPALLAPLESLHAAMKAAFETSPLPAEVPKPAALDAFLVRLRLEKP